MLKKQTVASGYKYDDDGNILLYKKGKHKGEPKLAYIYKDLTFYQNPCAIKPQLAFLSVNRSYSFINNFSKASISVINGRIKLPFKLTAKQKNFSQIRNGNVEMPVLFKQEKVVLHISFTKSIRTKYCFI